MSPRAFSVVDVWELGEPPYREIWFFADLRGGNEYVSARMSSDGELTEIWVHGLAIAHQRQKDGTPGSFLLVELDANADVIEDWTELDVEEAKAHGSALGGAETVGLLWEPIPDSADVRSRIRQRLGTSKPDQ
jgi:hypothetical protein